MITKTMTHAPTPWKFIESDWTIRTMDFESNNLMGDYQGCIVASFERAVGHGPEGESRLHAVPEMRANAAHIVRCVNEREEMLHLLRIAVAAEREEVELQNGRGESVAACLGSAAERIRNFLARAESTE